MFEEIERRREAAGIDQVILCERAQVHATRYSARKNNRSGMREATLARLKAALDELIAERGESLKGDA